MSKLTEVFWESVPKSWYSLAMERLRNFREDETGTFYGLVHFRLHQKTNKSMLDTGSCGLHIVHSAFKHGVDNSVGTLMSFSDY